MPVPHSPTVSRAATVKKMGNTFSFSSQLIHILLVLLIVRVDCFAGFSFFKEIVLLFWSEPLGGKNGYLNTILPDVGRTSIKTGSFIEFSLIKLIYVPCAKQVRIECELH